MALGIWRSLTTLEKRKRQQRIAHVAASLIKTSLFNRR